MFEKAWCCFCDQIVFDKDYYDHMDEHYQKGEWTDRDSKELVEWNMQTIEELEAQQLQTEYEYEIGELKLD